MPMLRPAGAFVRYGLIERGAMLATISRWSPVDAAHSTRLLNRPEWRCCGLAIDLGCLPLAARFMLHRFLSKRKPGQFRSRFLSKRKPGRLAARSRNVERPRCRPGARSQVVDRSARRCPRPARPNSRCDRRGNAPLNAAFVSARVLTIALATPVRGEREAPASPKQQMTVDRSRMSSGSPSARSRAFA